MLSTKIDGFNLGEVHYSGYSISRINKGIAHQDARHRRLLKTLYGVLTPRLRGTLGMPHKIAYPEGPPLIGKGNKSASTFAN